MTNTNSKVGMFKAKFSNAVHKLLMGDNISLKNYKRKRIELTDKQKIEMFDQIAVIHNECSNELTSYQYQRRAAKRLAKKRQENGYVAKKKTSLADYQSMQKEQAVA